MRRVLPVLLLASLPAWATTETVTRLVIADHATPIVTVLAEDGATLLRIETGEPVRLHEGTHHGQVALRAPGLGRVTLLESGISVEGHGDHADLHVAAPRLLPAVLEGPRPSHVVGSDGRLGVFFDGDGTALVLAAGRDADAPRRIMAAHPHHGVAFPYAAAAGPMIALSQAPAAGERPSILEQPGRPGGGPARGLPAPAW
jgi:hypothetical protein